MKETIFIKFHDPEAKIVKSSYPHKIELYDNYMEMFTKNNVITPDEEKGIEKEWNIDVRTTLRRDRIDGVDIYWNNDIDSHALNIHGSHGSTTFFFETKQEQLDTYIKLKSWICK